MTLRMFEHLLQKPDEHILYNLVLRNLEERNYTEYKPPCQEDKDVVENGQIAGAVYVPFFHSSMLLEECWNSIQTPCFRSNAEITLNLVKVIVLSDILNPSF